MSSSPIDTNPATSIAWLVQFQWGISNVARYTSWTSDLVFEENTYSSFCQLLVTPPAMDGTTDDKTWTLDMAVAPPVDTMITQRTHARVRADIWQVNAGDTTQVVKLFAGTATRSQTNPYGQSGKVKLFISGWKYSLPWAMGVPAYDSCVWTFGDKHCAFDVAALQETHTITAMTGDTITLDALTTTKRWLQGYVMVDGLAIGILDYPGGSVLRLNKFPPASWLDSSALVTPGCDKIVTTCDGTYANTKRFAGLGIAMPDYHPELDPV